MKNIFVIILSFLELGTINSCGQLNKKNDDMSEKKDFGWGVSVTAPEDYPVSIHKGYMATGEKFICGFGKVAVEDNGWQSIGAGGTGGSTIPTEFSLTWVSFAERKFWTIDTTLPGDKILALFREGFDIKEGWGTVGPATYKNIIICVAPGGVVVVRLAGDWHSVEIGRYQAKETFVEVNDFVPVPGAYQDLTEFYDYNFEHEVPKPTQELIKKQGIPFGLWDAYRQQYNWRFRLQFYKDDMEPYRHVTYLNGEENVLYAPEMEAFSPKPLPWRADFYFSKYWAETVFDDAELMAVFKELTKDNKDQQIEIVAKVGFEYNDVTFIAVAGDKRKQLTKVTAKFWSNK